MKYLAMLLNQVYMIMNRHSFSFIPSIHALHDLVTGVKFVNNFYNDFVHKYMISSKSRKLSTGYFEINTGHDLRKRYKMMMLEPLSISSTLTEVNQSQFDDHNSIFSQEETIPESLCKGDSNIFNSTSSISIR